MPGDEVFLALIALVAAVIPAAIAALVWALKRSFKANEALRVSLENHFATETKVLQSIGESLERWEIRWQEGLIPRGKN